MVLDSLLILINSAALFEQPSLQANIIQRINIGKYKCVLNQEENAKVYYSNKVEFVKLFLNKGKQGYIELKSTSKYINRTLRVAMINGEWKIVEYFCLTP